ncbi:MAG: phosphoribosylaminoimidazolesuccinocarboxamide synthase [Proteobacteria bacterium]|nr:phosphoribosylaminoimidazolesuccinocarboxamide synthase [Pseudomonadota bacterium]
MDRLLISSRLQALPVVKRGKVRDIYRVGDEFLLIVATDRLSAFDVILPTPIPGKGRVLTSLSNFWFGRTGHIVENHLTDAVPEDFLVEPADLEQTAKRAVVVKAVKPLPIEAIVRGYLAGSGWREYQATRTVCGIRLPDGLRLAEKLPEPIFTPSTKADIGEHDRNISLEEAEGIIGKDLAARVRSISLEIFREATRHADAAGIIIADTKMEFGVDDGGELILIDELLTPDSSRFWPKDEYATGRNPPSFDKQFVRDYLEEIRWDKRPPAPELPPEVAAKTAEKYREALVRLTGSGQP